MMSSVSKQIKRMPGHLQRQKFYLALQKICGIFACWRNSGASFCISCTNFVPQYELSPITFLFFQIRFFSDPLLPRNKPGSISRLHVKFFFLSKRKRSVFSFSFLRMIAFSSASCENPNDDEHAICVSEHGQSMQD